LQGIWPREALGKDRKIGGLRAKFPRQRISEFFAADQGFWKHEQRICPTNLRGAVLLRPDSSGCDLDG
jgi:hypothetical protein